MYKRASIFDYVSRSVLTFVVAAGLLCPSAASAYGPEPGIGDIVIDIDWDWVIDIDPCLFPPEYRPATCAPMEPPRVPSLSLTGVSNSASSGDKDGSYTLSWKSAGGTVTYYELQERTNSGAFTAVPIGVTSSKTISGKADGRYGYRARACNPEKCSAWTAAKYVQVLRTPPKPDLFALAIGMGSWSETITLAWSLPNGNADRYHVYQLKGGSYQRIATVNESPFITTPDTGGAHSFRVQACNSLSCSASSDPANANIVKVSVPAKAGSEYVVRWAGLGGQRATLVETGPTGTRQFSVTGTGSQSIKGRIEGEYSYYLKTEGCSTSPYEGGELTLCFPASTLPKTVKVDLPEIIADPAIEPTSIASVLPLAMAVERGGKLSATVPLDLPPGVNGLSPNLTLRYDTPEKEDKDLDQLAGYGWTLSGIEFIEKKPGVGHFLNGDVQLVLDDRDRLLGSEWTYRLKNNPAVRVTVKQDSSGADWYYMQSGDRIISFGKSPQSRYPNTGETERWYAEEITDHFGNQLNIKYFATTAHDSSQSRIFPRTISYGGYRVDFDYGYANKLVNGNLGLVLNRIESHVPGAKISEYRLAYRTTSGKRHISAIQRCGFDLSGGKTCTQPMTIGWRSLPIDESLDKNIPLIVDRVVAGLGREESIDYVHETENRFWDYHIFEESPFFGEEERNVDFDLIRQHYKSKERWVVASITSATGVGTTGITEYAYDHLSSLASVIRRKDPDGTVVYSRHLQDDALTKSSKITNGERWTGFAGRPGSRRLSISYTQWATKYFHSPDLSLNQSFHFTYPCVRAQFAVDGQGNIGQGKLITLTPTWNDMGLITEQKVQIVTGNVEANPPGTTPFGSNCEVSWTPPAPSELTHLAASNYSLEEITTSFANDTKNWLIGFASREVTKRSSMLDNTPHIMTIDRVQVPGTLRASKVVEMAGTAAELITTTEYSSKGNPLTITTSGPSIKTRTSRFEDYLDDRFPQTITNAMGHSIAFTYDRRFGLPASIRDPNGLTTTEERNGLGQVTRTTLPGGSKIETITVLCGDCPRPAKYKSTRIVQHPASALLGSPKVTAFYDSRGRIVRQQHQSFAGDSIKIDTAYDDLGRIHKQTLPYSSGSPEFIFYHYDLRSRLMRTEYPDGSSKSHSYTDLLAGIETVTTEKIVGPADVKTQSRLETYNILGQLVHAVDAFGTPLAVTTDYRYDALGDTRWVRINNDEDTIVTTLFDVANNRKTINDPSTGTTVYQLNALGQITRQTDANGSVVTFDYDLLGRVTQRIDDATGNHPIANRFTYDTRTNGIGMLASRSSPGFREDYYYTPLAQLREIQTAIDVPGYSTEAPFISTYAYDAYGRVASQQYPGGLVTHTDYNEWGYAYQLRDDSQVLSRLDSADAFGNATQVTLGNGLVTNRTYDPKGGWLTEVRTGGGLIQDNTYHWWSNGTLHSREKGIAGVSESLTYDVLNRLTTASAQGKRSLSFTYDHLGNLTTKQSSVAGDADLINYQYAANQPYRLDQVTMHDGMHTYHHDAVGNIIKHQAPDGADDRHLVYNAFGKPTRISKGGSLTPSVVEEILYGPDGERFFRSSLPSGNRTIYLYGGTFEINLPATGPLTAIEKTYLGKVIHFREVTLAGTNAERYAYVHTDHLGSVEVMTDESGSPFLYKDFDPFGSYRTFDWSSDAPPTSPTEQLLHTSRGFTGHEHLDDTGLIHMNGRVYDPALGRFMSADPIVQAPTYSQSYNRYSYVWNNPLSMTDPSGYCGLLGDITGYCETFTISDGYQNEKNLREVGGGLVSQYSVWYTDGEFISEVVTTGQPFMGESEVHDVGSVMIAGSSGPSFAAEHVSIRVNVGNVGCLQSTCLTEYPEYEMRYAFDESGNQITRRTTYSEEWLGVDGAGDLLEDLVTSPRKRFLPIDVAVKMRTTGEEIKYAQYVRTVKAEAVFTDNTPVPILRPYDYGPWRETGKTEWLQSGRFLRSFPTKVVICPISCAGMNLQ